MTAPINEDIHRIFESESETSSTASEESWTDSGSEDWLSPTTVAIQNIVTHNHRTAKIDLAQPPKHRRLSYHPSVRLESALAPKAPSSSSSSSTTTHETPSPWTPRWYEREMSFRPSPTFWPPRVDAFGKTIPKYKPPKPDGVEARHLKIRKYERQHKGMNFMRRLFRDLDDACRNTTTKMEDEELLELLRLAAVWEIYHEAPNKVKDVYHERLHGPLSRFKESRRIGEVGDVVITVLKGLYEEQYKVVGQRAYEFIKEHGLFTFVVCAHSYYFRRWNATGVLDTDDQKHQRNKSARNVQDRSRGSAEDENINTLINDNKASIEMFVRSRKFDWRRLAKDHKVFFRTFFDVISTVAPDEADMLEENVMGMRMITRSQFQKKKRYLTDWDNPARSMDSPILSFPKLRRDQHPHELVLSLDGKRAIRSQIEVPYSLTQKPVSEGGFQKRHPASTKRKPRQTTTTTAAEDAERTSYIDVKIISTSFLAPDYIWPHSNRWPIPDPRYRSKVTERCALCHKGPKPCLCTLEDLQTELRRTIPGYSCDPLIELRQYPVKGTGVRTLQPLRKGDILAEYIGEIYPDIFYGTWPGINDDKSIFGKYYPGGAATVYHMSCEISGREFKKEKTTKLQNETVKLTLARPVPSLKEPEKLPEDEYDMHVIDSAVYGNWTRYINHSCKAAATFQTLYLGNKMVSTVTMVREMEFGEELTVDYGELYWSGGRKCVCGESNCVSDRKEVSTGDDEDEEEEDEEQDQEVLDTIVVDMTASRGKKRKRT